VRTTGGASASVTLIASRPLRNRPLLPDWSDERPTRAFPSDNVRRE